MFLGWRPAHGNVELYRHEGRYLLAANTLLAGACRESLRVCRWVLRHLAAELRNFSTGTVHDELGVH